MNEQFFVTVEIDDDKLRDIMKRLQDAQEAIYACYAELRDLNLLSIKKKEADSKN